MEQARFSLFFVAVEPERYALFFVEAELFLHFFAAPFACVAALADLVSPFVAEPVGLSVCAVAASVVPAAVPAGLFVYAVAAPAVAPVGLSVYVVAALAAPAVHVAVGAAGRVVFAHFFVVLLVVCVAAVGVVPVPVECSVAEARFRWLAVHVVSHGVVPHGLFCC